MQNNGFFFPQAIYKEHLSLIDGVNFTPREMDVISCLVNLRGTRKISSLLSIAPSTVLSYVQNIMLKIGCNSRESIIDFMEQSSAFPLIKKHYGHLVIYTAFKKVLKNIKEENKKLKIQIKAMRTRLIFYGEHHVYKDLLLHHLPAHLKQAGIHAKIEAANNKIGENKTEKLKNKTQGLILILEPGGQEKIPKGLCNFDSLDISEHQNYYFLTFDILKKLLPGINFDFLLNSFIKQHKVMLNYSNEKYFDIYKGEKLDKKPLALFHKTMQNLRNYTSQFWLPVLFILIFYFEIQCIKGRKDMQVTQSKESPIRSHLVIPIDSLLLNRPEEIAKIDNSFKNQNTGIHPIALVGPGGAGKTTLARQFVHQQTKANIVWELNAETSGSLIASFEVLATALAKTEESQKLLKALQDVKNTTEREEKIIQFVKENLRSYPEWFLIFDNVENIIELQKYLPQDSETWGKGKVMITTRDRNIENNKHIHFTLPIGELTHLQKLSLFTKIITHGDSRAFTTTQTKEAKQFLENIPSYPLDVSVAAYYIKTTNIPYGTYLENLSQNNKDFTTIQENLLKVAGDYKKTRYGIISLSLQHLINTDKNFGELMLFISLLGSQNIPRQLLSSYKSALVIDNFIYNLKKYSLVMPEFSNDSHKIPTISFHRSIQEISLSYLTSTLNESNNKLLIQSIAKNLETYVLKAIEKEDLSEMKLLANHCEVFLSHDALLTPDIRGSLGSKLGGIYFYLSDYGKAKAITEESLVYLKESGIEKSKLAWALASLGNTYKELGNHGKAKDLLEESLEVYKKYSPDDYKGIAQALTYLGNIYKLMGHQDKAKDLLEQSLTIYKEHLPDHPVGVARGLAYLGNVYTNMGNYKKAQEFLEESLIVYKKHFPPTHVGIGRALEYLGLTYRDAGEHEKAKVTLEQCIEIYKLYFPEDHVRVIWVVANLADAYKAQGNYAKSKDLLEKSLIAFKKNLHANHFRAAWALAHLGDIHRVMGNHKEAKALFEQSLAIYKKHFPPDHVEVVWVSECLIKVSQVLGERGGAKKAKDLEAQKNENSE